MAMSSVQAMVRSATAWIIAGLVASASAWGQNPAPAERTARASAGSGGAAANGDARAAPIRRRALLVGASDYPAASGAKALPGVRNDIVLLRETLLRLGMKAGDIRVLADGVPGADGAPTRGNILGALRDAVKDARPGDFFYLHMGGHGSQAPVDPGHPGRKVQTDGLNELFLPIDIGKWDGARFRVTNAVYDDDLIEVFDDLRGRGAFVWATFDACHSATLVRGEPDGLVLREVAPTTLGIPDVAVQREAASAGAPTRGTGEPSSRAPDTLLGIEPSARPAGGGFVAFYAAQTTETAPELPLPTTLPAGDPLKKPHGVFTYLLAEALNTFPGATYRQVAQHILSRYAGLNIGPKPTPVFSGTHLDAVALGDTAQAPVRQWAVKRAGGGAKIDAGLLSSVPGGSLLAVVPNPLAPTSEALGFVEVERAGLFSADLRPATAASGFTPALLEQLPEGAYARLHRPAIDFRLRVALPTFHDKVPASTRATIDEAMRLLRRDDGADARIEWVPPRSAGADFRLHVEDDHLWQLPAGGQFAKAGAGKSPSLLLAEPSGRRSPATLAMLLGENLGKMGQALRLMRLGDQLSAGTLASAVTISLLHAPKDPKRKPVDLTNPRGMALQGGDTVYFTIVNTSRTPVDVTLLYIDSDFGISALFPQGGELNRIPSGGVLSSREGLQPIVLDDRTVGIERLIAIVTAAPSLGEAVSYADLAQQGVVRTRGTDMNEDPLGALLEQATFGKATTRAAGRGPVSQAVMRSYVWEIRAAP